MMPILMTGCNSHFRGIERCLHDNYEHEEVRKYYECKYV